MPRSIRCLLLLLLLLPHASACDDGDRTAEDAVAVGDTGPGDAAEASSDGAAAPVVDSGGGLAPADAGATDGPAPDAGTSIRPDTLPLDAPATLDGAPDLTQPVPGGTARAGRVDTDDERLRGPAARCRIGDYRLDNDRISVCIQGPENSGLYAFGGGTIVDAHRADRPGTDLLDEIVISPGFGEVSALEVGIVRDGTEGGAAVLRTDGRTGGARVLVGFLPSLVPGDARVVTEYHLEPDVDTVEVLTWIEADVDTVGLQLVDLAFFGDRSRLFLPGADVEGGGFVSGPYVGAWGADVSYAWTPVDQPARIVPFQELLPILPVYATEGALRPGDMLLARRRFRVGTGDIESVRPAPEGATAVEFEGPPGAHVIVEREAGGVETTLTLAEDGRATAALLPGDWRANVVEWSGIRGGRVPPVGFEVGGEPTAVVLAPPVPGTLVVDVRDQRDLPIDARIDLRGPDEDARRIFHVDGASTALPPGEWTATVTRGWHFDAAEVSFRITAGEQTQLNVRLQEVIPFDGWSSGEFHQHAEPSTDSEVPVEERIRSNLVEGVGFVVPSDHDWIFDYAGIATAMGVDDRIAMPLDGVEISPLTTHLGAYGEIYDPTRNAGGAPALATLTEPGGRRFRRKTIPELVVEARGLGAQLVQINHPRSSQGLFDDIGYEPGMAVDALDVERFTTDFDSIEVHNGAGDFCQVLADWMGLLVQDVRITGVGNSDTHSLGSPAGYPRNYLPTAAEQPQGITGAEILAAMRAGRVTVGGGAVMDFPDGPLPGDTVDGSSGTLSVRVRVRTPPFARIDRIVAFHNGAIVLELPVEAAEDAIVDFDEVLDVPVDADGPTILVAMGAEPLRYIGGSTVFAFANPFWTDVDGGGSTPPGPRPIDVPALPGCR